MGGQLADAGVRADVLILDAFHNRLSHLESGCSNANGLDVTAVAYDRLEGGLREASAMTESENSIRRVDGIISIIDSRSGQVWGEVDQPYVG
jgi:hypothetical protein